MQTQFTEQIDGCEVLVTLFEYDEASDLAFEIAHKVAPFAGALAEKGSENISLDALAVPMLMSAARSIDAKEWGSLVRRLLANVVVTGPFGEGGALERADLKLPARRTVAFRGRMLLSYKIMWFVMRVNFQDFIGALGLTGLTLAAPKQ
jgi:hypothetical protein